MVQIVNSASLSFPNMSVNEKPIIGLFWSRGRRVYGRQRRVACLSCKSRFHHPAQLRAIPAGALI